MPRGYNGVERAGDGQLGTSLRIEKLRGNFAVYILEDEGPVGDDKEAAVWFCVSDVGYERSPATRNALLALMRAIEEDNLRNPINP